MWADERVYYPVHAEPYCPAHRLAGGKADPLFHTKWWIAADLALRATEDGVAFRAVTGDCAYGDIDAFRRELGRADLPFVLAVRPKRGKWAYGHDAYTPVDAARALAWGGPADPGDWRLVRRRFRDGTIRTWWAADAALGAWQPDGHTRLVVATTDPATLPDQSTWYLATDLPRPAGPHDPAAGGGDSPRQAADLAEIVRIYGLRNWVEQSYKQIKDELGWADFQVRSATAIRRHQTLVNCAFTFCWTTGHPPPDQAPDPAAERGRHQRLPPAPAIPTAPTRPQPAPHTPHGPLLADPRHHAHTLVEQLVHQAPAP